MKAIRVVSIGLIISACLIYWSAIDFFKWVMNESDPFHFLEGVNAISPAITDVGGMKMIVAASFIIACLGAGLFISATIYVRLDSAVCGMYEAFCLRNEQSDYAKQDQLIYRA